MEEKQLTPEQEKLAGIYLSSLVGAPVPNVKAIRESLRGMTLENDGVSPEAAYNLVASWRPTDWTPLPTYQDLMAG